MAAPTENPEESDALQPPAKPSLPLRILEGTARVISGDFKLVLRESDQGRWYYRFDTHEIGYLREDLKHRDEDIPLGFMMHEVSHALHSDLSVVDEEYRENTAFHTLLNAIEDVRVNEIIMRTHPGCIPQLRKLYSARFFIPEDSFEAAALRMQSSPLHLQFAYGILYEWFMMETDPRISDLRVLELLEECTPNIKAAYKAGTSLESYTIIRDRIWPKYKELVEEAKNSAVEQELAKNSGKLHKAIPMSGFEQKTEGIASNAPHSEPGLLGQEQKGKDLSQTSALRRKLEEKVESSFQKAEGEFIEQTRGKMLPDLTKTGNSVDEKSYAEQFSLGKKRRDLEESAIRLKAEQSRELEATSKRVQNILHGERLKREGISLAEEEFYREYLDRVHLYILALVRQLKTVFKDVTHQRMVTNLASGDLSQSTLAIVPTGTDKLFERPLTPGKFEYNISILVDESDSMLDGEKYKRAIEGVVLLQEALSQIGGIQFEVVGFNLNPCISHKTFEERLTRKKAVKIIQDIEDNIGGTTMDTEALTQACERIQRERGKNLIIILTDGNPNKPAGRTDLEAVIKKAKRVRVFALGIGGSNLVEKVYPTGLSVDGLAEVPSKLANILRRELRK